MSGRKTSATVQPVEIRNVKESSASMPFVMVVGGYARQLGVWERIGENQKKKKEVSDVESRKEDATVNKVPVRIRGYRSMHVRAELRLARVKVDAHVDRGGVDTLNVSVEDAVEIICRHGQNEEDESMSGLTEIVVLSADGIVVRRGDSHAALPAIVGTHGSSDVAVVGIDHRLHVARTDANVDLGVEAVGAVSRALFARDLHHANLASTTSNVCSAATLLKSDRGQEDGRDTGFLGHVLEHVQVRRASLENVSGCLEDGGQVLVDDVLERDWRRHPAVAVDTAVEPV